MNEEDLKRIEEEEKLKKGNKKKNPSVKDLFGGDDSEEEIDDDLRKRIIEKGGIDPHFPIKLPIIFKTNFHETQKKIDEKQEVSISKKWISIAPEPIQKQKNDGPKWKSIEEPSTSGTFLTKQEDSSSVVKAPKPERNRVTFLSPAKEVEDKHKEEEVKIQKSEKKVRLCKHGRILKDKKRDEKSENPKTIPVEEPIVRDVPEEIVIDDDGEVNHPAVVSDHSIENILKSANILENLARSEE